MICNRCKRYKTNNEMTRSSNTTSGFTQPCLECKKIVNKLYREQGLRAKEERSDLSWLNGYKLK